MPHVQNWKRRPVRDGLNSSALKTAHWQVNEESTRTIVLIVEKPMFSLSAWSAHSSAGIVCRTVKYIAKSAAKNMSSLASQTIVPTETGFGRLTVTCWCVGVAAAVAVDTRAIMADVRGSRTPNRHGCSRRISQSPCNVPPAASLADGFRQSAMKRGWTELPSGRGLCHDRRMTGMTTDVTSAATDDVVTSSPRVLLYSDDRTVREQVRLAVVPRLGAGAPEIRWTEVATPTEVVRRADDETWDLLVLDGEADKAGGMGLCRQ